MGKIKVYDLEKYMGRKAHSLQLDEIVFFKDCILENDCEGFLFASHEVYDLDNRKNIPLFRFKEFNNQIDIVGHVKREDIPLPISDYDDFFLQFSIGEEYKTILYDNTIPQCELIFARLNGKEVINVRKHEWKNSKTKLSKKIASKILELRKNYWQTAIVGIKHYDFENHTGRKTFKINKEVVKDKNYPNSYPVFTKRNKKIGTLPRNHQYNFKGNIKMYQDIEDIIGKDFRGSFVVEDINFENKKNVLINIEMLVDKYNVVQVSDFKTKDSEDKITNITKEIEILKSQYYHSGFTNAKSVFGKMENFNTTLNNKVFNMNDRYTAKNQTADAEIFNKKANDLLRESQKYTDCPDGNKKENKMNMNLNKMFGDLQIGKLENNKLAISPFGLAIKTQNGYVVYDLETNEAKNVGDLVFNDFSYIYLFPTAELKVGDIIMNNGKFVVITSVEEGIKAVDVAEGTEITMITTKNIFGMKLYVKAYNLMGNMTNKDGDIGSNMMQMMMMQEMMSGGIGGSGKSNLMEMMMMMQLMGGKGGNPFDQMFK